MKKILFMMIVLIPVIMNGQDDKKFGIAFNGYVKTDIYWDSRQTVSIREGQFYLYPANEMLDNNGQDINARPNFNFLSIQTRLHGDISGPDVLGAKTSAAIEGEFFGHSDADINGFRLRHAFVRLNWPKTELLVGQYWHPMFNTACYPDVVNFNTGVPFLPFIRSPQIRITQKLGGFKIYLTALSQLDFKSNGPDGPNIKYLRNTAIPAFNLNLEYAIRNANGFGLLVGVAGGFKSLLPRLYTYVNDTTQYKATEKIGSFCAQAFIKVEIPKLIIKVAGNYDQDAYDFTMIGGYAVCNFDDASRIYTYTPIATLSCWADIQTVGKNVQGGLFLGYSKNLGAMENVFNGIYYSRGNNIGYLYRISPRLIYNVGKFRLAPEIDYTVAAYGTPGLDGIPKDVKEIGNLRFLLGVYYFF